MTEEQKPLWTEADDLHPLVMDQGSHTVKAGLAGHDGPSRPMLSAVGRPRRSAMMVGMSGKDAYVGTEDMKTYISALDIHYPIHRGVIVNWDNLEKVWHAACYNQVRVAPEEHPFMYANAILSNPQDAAKAIQIWFETFTVPAFSMFPQPLLSLFAAGRTTGLVLDSGHGVTHAVPIVEGRVVEGAVQRIEVGGQDVTDDLRQKVIADLPVVPSATGHLEYKARQDVEGLKEKICYTALDAEEETYRVKAEGKKKYTLPDDRKLSLGTEVFMSPEVVWQPSLMGARAEVKGETGKKPIATSTTGLVGVHRGVYEAVMKCGPKIQQDLLNNILLSGGNSLLPGFPQRLAKELRTLFPHNNLSIMAPPERLYSPWIGGSILATVAPFEHMWVSKQEYDEGGPDPSSRKLCLLWSDAKSRE